MQPISSQSVEKQTNESWISSNKKPEISLKGLYGLTESFVLYLCFPP